MAEVFKKHPPRGIIYSSDIQKITGQTPETARRLMRKIRRELQKPKSSFITIKDFCMVTGLEETFVNEFLV